MQTKNAVVGVVTNNHSPPQKPPWFVSSQTTIFPLHSERVRVRPQPFGVAKQKQILSISPNPHNKKNEKRNN
jgi:hypothetical protein